MSLVHIKRAEKTQDIFIRCILLKTPNILAVIHVLR